MNILWLVSWYPNVLNPYEGDFIQRHAQAVSSFCNVTVIYVSQAGENFNTIESVNIKLHNENLVEKVIFFDFKKTGIKLLDKIIYNIKYYRTYKRILEKYTWPGMKKEIKDYIKNCHSCQINKTNRNPIKNPMEITTTSSEPFERLAIDIVGPLPLTENGNRFILTTQDDLTKYSYAIPLPNHDALTIAEELNKFISLFGIPKSILVIMEQNLLLK